MRLSRKGLLNLSTVDMGSQIILCSMCGVYVCVGENLLPLRTTVLEIIIYINRPKPLMSGKGKM